MVKTIEVDPGLADLVNKELHSAKTRWQYVTFTTDYYHKAKDDSIRRNIDAINLKYGPAADTQRFTDEFYNDHNPMFQKSGNFYSAVRSNPNSRYNRDFPNTARLIDHLQNTYIPPNYRVSRLMANMQTIRPTWSLNAPHPDGTSKDSITILYYANTSDGNTYFFEEDQCVYQASPIKGNAAIYPSCMMHAGSTPIATETRVVINIVFKPK